MGRLAKSESKTEVEKRSLRAGIVVGASSLCLNVVLGAVSVFQSTSKMELERKQLTMTNELQSLQLEKSKSEASGVSNDEKLKRQLFQFENQPDIKERYLILTANLEDFLEKAPSGTFQNEVLTDFKKWIPSREHKDSPMYQFSDNCGVTSYQHGIVMLELQNRGKVLAKGLSLELRKNNFVYHCKRSDDAAFFSFEVRTSEPKHPPMWKIDPSKWERLTYSVGDLKPGQTKLVPLVHVVGTERYQGVCYIPQDLTWENPVTAVRGERPVSKMLPADQWQIEGLNSVSQ